MNSQPAAKNASPESTAVTPRRGFFEQWLADWFTLRKPVPLLESALWGIACIVFCLVAWWFLTRGPAEERIVGRLTLPTPRETFDPRNDLEPLGADVPGAEEQNAENWKRFVRERKELAVNTLVTLRRVGLGFLLAIGVGVPLGIVAGCFPRFNAFLSPVVMFGRNIPLAAVLPLLLYMFHEGERRKVMFIFIACVAFIIADTAQAIMDVAERYVDTAYTLGASRWQTMVKVLVPLAMPTIFGSFRVLFGLAFGYIMLAESIKEADDVGGLGFQISMFQRRGPREYIYLIILIIPLVALAVDLVLFWIQRQLFPHVYGGSGWLQRLVRVGVHAWEDVKGLFVRYEPATVTSAVPPPGAPVVPDGPVAPVGGELTQRHGGTEKQAEGGVKQ